MQRVVLGAVDTKTHTHTHTHTSKWKRRSKLTQEVMIRATKERILPDVSEPSWSFRHELGNEEHSKHKKEHGHRPLAGHLGGSGREGRATCTRQMRVQAGPRRPAHPRTAAVLSTGKATEGSAESAGTSIPAATEF